MINESTYGIKETLKRKWMDFKGFLTEAIVPFGGTQLPTCL